MPQFYKKIDAIEVDYIEYSEVKGVPISYELPQKYKEVSFALLSCTSLSPIFKMSEIKLDQISIAHGRSFEVKDDSPDLFESKNGIFYSAITTKGNNANNISLMTTSQYALKGLQDSKAMIRILNVSKVFEEKGIESELILKIYEPLQFPYRKKLISLEEMKNIVLIKSIKDLQKKEDKNDVFKRITDISKYLNENKFFITVRGMQVAERLENIGEGKSLKSINKILQKTFDFLNKREKRVNNNPRILNVNNFEDIKYYFLELLPAKIATNVSKMHDLKLVHGYLHTGNISTVGSIYDLDSVKGCMSNCDDDDVTDEEIYSDIDKSLDSLKQILNHYNKYNPILGNEEEINKVERIFLKEYMLNRTSVIDSEKLLYIIKAFTENINILDPEYASKFLKLNNFCEMFIRNQEAETIIKWIDTLKLQMNYFDNNYELLDLLLNKISNHINWDYKVEKDPEEYFQDFINVTRTNAYERIKSYNNYLSKPMKEELFRRIEHEIYNGLYMSSFDVYVLQSTLEKIRSLKIPSLLKILREYDEVTYESLIDLYGNRESIRIFDKFNNAFERTNEALDKLLEDIDLELNKKLK